MDDEINKENKQPDNKDKNENRLLHSDKVTGNRYVKLVEDTITAKNIKDKLKLMNKVQKYLIENSYIIQKFMDNLDIRDKIKITAKLKKLKENEIEVKLEKQKDYNKIVIAFSMICLILTSLFGIYEKNEIIIVITIVIVGVISVFFISIEDYIYDINGLRKELKSLDSWLDELHGEEIIYKENNKLSNKVVECEEDLNVLQRENKDLKQKNKKLEDDLAEMKANLDKLLNK